MAHNNVPKAIVEIWFRGPFEYQDLGKQRRVEGGLTTQEAESESAFYAVESLSIARYKEPDVPDNWCSHRNAN